MNRRRFLKTAGYSTIAGLALPGVAFPRFDASQTSRSKTRVAVLFEPDFPSTQINAETLRQALDGFTTSFLGVAELPDKLSIDRFDIFINPYGSRFPATVWPAILAYLIAGGNWVNLGGAPFRIPVVRDANNWRAEVEQTQYHKRLGITQAFPVATTAVTKWQPNDLVPMTSELFGNFSADTVNELYLRLTNSKSFPDEDGSDGPREALVTPLVSGLNKDGRSIAVPFLQIDRIKGEFTGGRWILATTDGALAPTAIRALAITASAGSHEFYARPTFACTRDDATPQINIVYRNARAAETEKIKATCSIKIFDQKGDQVGKTDVPVSGTTSYATANAFPTFSNPGSLKPGLYRVEAELKVQGNTSGIRSTNGFWIYDAKLMSAGQPFTTDEYMFLRNGEPYPVTGTTYMATDVHRQFLFEPNPYLWDRDFTEMKRAGINMVRTGIWTGWQNLNPREPHAPMLAALDAFLLTAHRHDISVIFTFFAFLPESWGGLNAFLDPKSISNQKQFIQRITSRYSHVNDVMWDLINEPSFCSPKHLWSCRPNYDQYESQAWTDWLKERFPANNDQEREDKLREMWRVLPGQSLGLPRLDEFNDRNIFEAGVSLKVMEYRLFAQDVFRRWTKEMTKAIRSNGNPRQLITVGQDEGGTSERPNNQFIGDALDFTCNHTWWLNDDLVWDSVMTKVAGRPNLIEETGVMFYEKSDGGNWRTEDEARNLLERKLALAIGVSGSGFIQWIWNTNIYMLSDNEAAIGLLRADGSAKPEFFVLRDIAKFVADIKPWLKKREPEPVVMVIPHSNMFSVRGTATEATQRAVRAMHYHCRVPMRAVSEYNLSTLKEIPRLIVLPSPRILRDDAYSALMKLVEAGSTLMVSGPLGEDEHWRPVRHLAQNGTPFLNRPVAQEEILIIDGVEHTLTFRGEKIQRIEKSVLTDDYIAAATVLPTGKGNILWSTLPVELSDNVEPIISFYRSGIKLSGIVPIFTAAHTDPSVLVYVAVYQQALLLTIVNEGGRNSSIHLTLEETKTPLDFDLHSQRSTLVLVSRKDGRIIGRYN